MFKALMNEARSRKFRRMYVETPSDHPDYARVATYLLRAGFKLQARLSGYYARDVDQLILSMNL